MQMIRRAYWINNPLLANQFEIFLDCHMARRQLNPTQFMSSEWESSPVDVELKKRFMVKRISSFLMPQRSLGRAT